MSLWLPVAAAGVLAVALGTASGLTIPEDAAAESMLRAVGFSPYGIAMLWIANDVRKKLPPLFESINDRAKTLEALMRDYIEVSRAMAAAVRERTLAEQSGFAPTNAPRGHGRRPKTNPHDLPR